MGDIHTHEPSRISRLIRDPLDELSSFRGGEGAVGRGVQHSRHQRCATVQGVDPGRSNQTDPETLAGVGDLCLKRDGVRREGDRFAVQRGLGGALKERQEPA